MAQKLQEKVAYSSGRLVRPLRNMFNRLACVPLSGSHRRRSVQCPLAAKRTSTEHLTIVYLCHVLRIKYFEDSGTSRRHGESREMEMAGEVARARHEWTSCVTTLAHRGMKNIVTLNRLDIILMRVSLAANPQPWDIKNPARARARESQRTKFSASTVSRRNTEKRLRDHFQLETITTKSPSAGLTCLNLTHRVQMAMRSEVKCSSTVEQHHLERNMMQ